MTVNVSRFGFVGAFKLAGWSICVCVHPLRWTRPYYLSEAGLAAVECGPFGIEIDNGQQR